MIIATIMAIEIITKAKRMIMVIVMRIRTYNSNGHIQDNYLQCDFQGTAF